MTHLSEEHLLELLEGDTAEAGHLDACAVCRERLEALRHTLGWLRDDPVPEPSPLFWQHLSDRVRLAIDHESADVRIGADEFARWWLQRRWRWIVAAAVVVLVASFVVLTNQRIDRSENVADRSDSIASPRADGRDDLNWTIPADDTWAMMAGLAEGLDFETAADAGLVVRPGSVDQVLLSLSDEERSDLAGIIQAELDRSSL